MRVSEEGKILYFNKPSVEIIQYWNQVKDKCVPKNIFKNLNNKKDFEITVLRANRSLSGAKEAGRYEATIYCVNKFGSSDIAWILDPEDVSAVTSSNSIFIKGRCRI